MKLKFDTLLNNALVSLEIYDTSGALVYTNGYITNAVGFIILDATSFNLTADDTYSCYMKHDNFVVSTLNFVISESNYYDEDTFNFITSNHDDDFTFQQALRLQSAALLGKAQQIGNVIRFKSIGDTKTLITATVDQDGNRLAVTLDKT